MLDGPPGRDTAAMLDWVRVFVGVWAWITADVWVWARPALARAAVDAAFWLGGTAAALAEAARGAATIPFDPAGLALRPIPARAYPLGSRLTTPYLPARVRLERGATPRQARLAAHFWRSALADASCAGLRALAGRWGVSPDLDVSGVVTVGAPGGEREVRFRAQVDPGRAAFTFTHGPAGRPGRAAPPEAGCVHADLTLVLSSASLYDIFEPVLGNDRVACPALRAAFRAAGLS